MEVILATGNTHKARELQQILSPHKVLIPADLGINFDCEETGTTYLANAMLKAETLYKLAGRPVLADDSGISLPALGGAPGIYSARYGSDVFKRMLEADERNRYLIENLKDKDDWSAFFVCSMVLMVSDYRFYTVQETMEGMITERVAGQGGFGYDPVFYLKKYNMTVAEISEEDKNRISHRGKAGKKIKLILDDLGA